MTINQLRLRINALRVALAEIEELLVCDELQGDEEQKFYGVLTLQPEASAYDLYCVLNVNATAKNGLAQGFMGDGSLEPRHIQRRLKLYRAFEFYTWLRELDVKRLDRFRRVGPKGKQQLLVFFAEMDELMKKA